MSTDHIASEGLLILPHLRIQNANAISSPLTHGFPSITAFIGLTWALERKLAAEGVGLSFVATGVISHHHQEQVNEDYVNTFRLTRNPVNENGATAAIVEEGRMHLDITLILALVWNPDDTHGNVLRHGMEEARQALANRIADLVSTGRIAGGSVLPSQPAPGRRIRPQLLVLPENAEERTRQFRRLRRQWIPGFALVGRDDLLQQRTHQLQSRNISATALDAWLDLSRFNWRAKSLPDGGIPPNGKVEWHYDRPEGSGWIVPIPVGYGALSDAPHEAGSVANARDSDTPFRFVESLYSIGQWVSPHRLNDVDQLLWYADSRPDEGVYRCHNDYRPAGDTHNTASTVD